MTNLLHQVFFPKILSEALNYKQKQIHKSIKRRAPQETLTNGKKKRRKNEQSLKMIEIFNEDKQGVGNIYNQDTNQR